jgi:quercetin dioxygenase-like cupin family protein
MDHSAERRRQRLFTGGSHAFDLREWTAALREEPEFERNGRTGETLVKAGPSRVVLEVLREGAGLARHKAPGQVLIQVLEGRVCFTLLPDEQADEENDGEAIYLDAGELLSMPPGQVHAVEAMRNSAFLIIIALEKALHDKGQR